MRQAALPLNRKRRGRPRYVETAEEDDVLRACLEYLGLRGIPHWRANSGAAKIRHRDGSQRFVRFGVRGQSDILGILPGSFCPGSGGGGKLLAVETKAPGGRLSPDQAAFLEMVNRAGGLGIVVHNVDELAAALKRFTGGDE